MSIHGARADISNRRIKALKDGDNVSLDEAARRGEINIDNLDSTRFKHTTIINTPNPLPTPNPTTIPLATILKTTYTDDVDHPLSTFEAVLNNRSVPNKFRVRARVKSIISRGLGGMEKGLLVQAHCAKCRRQCIPPILLHAQC